MAIPVITRLLHAPNEFGLARRQKKERDRRQISDPSNGPDSIRITHGRGRGLPETACTYVADKQSTKCVTDRPLFLCRRLFSPPSHLSPRVPFSRLLLLLLHLLSHHCLSHKNSLRDMKMEAGYESMDSLYELPPVPADFHSMEYSSNGSFVSTFNSLESIVPFPSSDFSPSCFALFDNDHLQIHQPGPYSFFHDSPFSLIDLHHAKSTHLDEFFYPDATAPFIHMPDLRCIEQTTTVATTSFSCSPPPPPPPPPPSPPPLTLPGPGEKRCRFGSDSLVKSGLNISSSSTSGSPAASSHSTTARARRQKIAEKTRSLEKLMPWEKKMDMATLLEEACKYIKFLQAQIAALRWMPLESAYYGGGDSGGRRGGDDGFLRMLNRQQILRVLANSPAAQTTLYRRGCCVFSHEQLLSLKMMAKTPRNL